MKAPFQYFGGKRTIAPMVWDRLDRRSKHYIEPFCGSCAVLLENPKPCSLEVIGDWSGFIANFWRATINQSEAVARWADYPVIHIDLGARHVWLMAQRERLQVELSDPDWPGDPKVAGWWLWGQCCWIGSGWCDWDRKTPVADLGQIPHVSDAGRGIQAIGKIPHVSDAGRGMWTSGGATALRWLGQIADRMERVRVIHGDWSRCLNNHYGGSDTAIFLDPPYLEYEGLYAAHPSAKEAAEWARSNAHLRIAICGHVGDYDLPGWDAVQWDRGRLTYSGSKTTADECVWFSPACRPAQCQGSMF
jgi:hypothetical protein